MIILACTINLVIVERQEVLLSGLAITIVLLGALPLTIVITNKVQDLNRLSRSSIRLSRTFSLYST